MRPRHLSIPAPIRVTRRLHRLATIGLCATTLPLTAQTAPYDVQAFRPVLDESKLQAPSSSPAKIEQGDFAGQSNEFFFLDPTGQYLTFTVTGDSKRSELRQMSGDWDTATDTPVGMAARVKVYVPETPELQQYTFLQIHDTTDDPGALNKPLLRVTRRGDYRKTRDHLWAHVRVPADPDQPISSENLDTENVDLGPRPEGFFDAQITVHQGRLVLTIDGQTKLDKDVSYWNGLNNYFKAGVYNQDPGTSKVEFESLRYFSGETPDDSAATAHDDAKEPE